MSKTNWLLAVGIAASLMLAAQRQILAADGTTSKTTIFKENPAQSDPAQELQRLRNEGVAKYESGLAIEDALKAFEHAFELSGQAADAFNVAIGHFNKNDIEGTKKWLEKTLQADANFPNAYYLAGAIARSEGDAAGAKKNWERARAT